MKDTSKTTKKKETKTAGKVGKPKPPPKKTATKKKTEKVVKVKEPKPQKGFKFVVKDDIKYEVPKARVDAEYVDGKAHCPTCHQRNFEVTSVDCGDEPFTFKGEGTCRICTTRINYTFILKLNDDKKEEEKDGGCEGKPSEPVQKRRKKSAKAEKGDRETA